MADADDNSTPPAQPATTHVSVKAPPFDENTVSRWFLLLESQFDLARITSSETKFHHALSNLPIRASNQLDDSVVTSKDYDTLKTTVIALFTKPKPELFDSLINQHKIMFSKPSTYLRDIRRIGTQLGVDDQFLKLQFLKSLPDNILGQLLLPRMMTIHPWRN